MEQDDYFTKTVYNGKWKRFTYNAIDAYKEVSSPDEWLNCPVCGKKPLVWLFDNGNRTACGCGKNRYDKFSIQSESIMSYIKRNNGSALHYDSDQLRKNWNHWCKTGEFLYIHDYANTGIW